MYCEVNSVGFWEESLKYNAIFSFSLALVVIQPVTTKQLASIEEVDTRPFGAILQTVELIGEREWVRSSMLTSVKVS
jgi:hypothetical protein